MIAHNSSRLRAQKKWHFGSLTNSHTHMIATTSQRSSPSSRALAFSIKQNIQQKSASAHKKSNQKLRNSSSKQKGVNSRQLSRQKILQHRIDSMIKEQQIKMKDISQSENKIRFGGSKKGYNLESESSMSQKIESLFSKFSEQENKENSVNPNKLIEFCPNHTQKSNKLSLRHYINSTPADKAYSEFKENGQQCNLSLLQSKKSKTRSTSSKVVLEEVRQLKEMFVQFLQRGSELKPHRKTSNWSSQSKQVYTLP